MADNNVFQFCDTYLIVRAKLLYVRIGLVVLLSLFPQIRATRSPLTILNVPAASSSHITRLGFDLGSASKRVRYSQILGWRAGCVRKESIRYTEWHEMYMNSQRHFHVLRSPTSVSLALVLCESLDCATSESL